MNYLGHLLVLPNSGLISLGNLLGDFFKGGLHSIEPLPLRQGVALHREIDRFTDSHPAVRRSIARIDPARRRVAGILVDVFYDHFLIAQAPLEELRSNLSPYVPYLPPDLQPLPSRMIHSHWFGAYSSIEGIGQVLARMQQRRKRITGLAGAEIELQTHHSAFAADLAEFFPDVVAFTSETLARLQSASPAEPPPALAAESPSGPVQSGQSDS